MKREYRSGRLWPAIRQRKLNVVTGVVSRKRNDALDTRQQFLLRCSQRTWQLLIRLKPCQFSLKLIDGKNEEDNRRVAYLS
jgi:hypothetical protein